MVDEQLGRLLGLRKRVDEIAQHHLASLEQFHLEARLSDSQTRVINLVGFTDLLPEWGSSGRRVAAPKPSLSSTMTCVRSLVHSYKLMAQWQVDGTKLIGRISERFAGQDLSSAGLPHLNVYTTSLTLPVLRLLDAKADSALVKDSVKVVRNAVAEDGVRLDDYPPNGYLTYWSLRSVEAWADAFALNVLDAGKRSIAWSEHELLRQLTASVEGEERNPYNLGYCLLVQRRFDPRSLAGGRAEAALRQLFDELLPRGVWEKRQPLFDFEKGSAYCFSFELLASLLWEYRHEPERLVPIDAQLERALLWIERNMNPHDDHRAGDPPAWRSGNRSTGSQPESWATAEVFSFLNSYRDYLTRRTQERLLLGLRSVNYRLPSETAFDDLIQPEIFMGAGASKVDLATLMKSRVLDPLRVTEDRFSLVNAPAGRRHPRAGILFGPPGTGKTTVVHRMASYLGWPIVELDPSDFARDGIALIPATISEIFRQLLELEDTVIFFDEMEVLMPNRAKLDAESVDPAVFTTSLLPKLQALHDRAKCLFFLATNHVDKIDSAVTPSTRPGRFDFAVQVRPPSIAEKLRMLGTSTSEPLFKAITAACSDPEVAMRVEWATRPEILDQLERLKVLTPDLVRDTLAAFSPQLLAQKDKLEEEEKEYFRFPGVC